MHRSNSVSLSCFPLIIEYGGYLVIRLSGGDYLAEQITAENVGSLEWKLAGPGQLTLYQGTRRFSVKHLLQD